MAKDVTKSDFPGLRRNGHWIWAPEDKIEMGSMFSGAPRSATEAAARWKTYDQTR